MITLLEHQTPPDVEWQVWMMVGGCGTGLTTGLIEYIKAHLREQGERASVGLMTPKLSDLHEHFALLGEEFTRTETSMRHEQGGELHGFSEATASWAKGRQFSLLAIDRLNHISCKSYERARAELRLKKPTYGQKGTNVAGRIVIATQPLTKRQVEEAGRDWIREIAEDEWTVVTRPDIAALKMAGVLFDTCGYCHVQTPDIIRHDIEAHDGMSRVLADHERLCKNDPDDSSCICRLKEYDAVYRTMKG